MGDRDSTYQNSKIGFEQSPGAVANDRLYMDDDAYMSFYGSHGDASLTGQQMQTLLWLQTRTQIIANSAGVLSTVNLPVSVGTIIISMADAASNASAWLTSGPLAGQVLEIFARGGGSQGSVLLSTSGVTIIGTLSGELSSIILHNSATSQAYIKLLCINDSEWSIVHYDDATVIQQGLA